ncbi:hypothetical protein IJH16_01520 [Candidatus Saccharibacteria bacterium]|nr:hypothetical protein [Candidatus Saccharibacteria bacterium]MBR5408904.1 hypothetical protein [Candidatus Saccharibacteria bacterium]
MQENYSDYQESNIPAFNQAKAYVFDTPELELYHELSAISEEIGKCRRSQLG